MKKILLLILSIGAVGMLNAQLAPEQVVSQNCGPTIGSVNITATGTLIASGDDVSGVITLPFPFTFPGGMTSTDLIAATNGYLSQDLADTGPDLSNDCPLPATPSTPNPTPSARMYPLHDDLICTIYGQALSVPHPNAAATQSYVIYYDNVNHFGSAEPFTMAVVLWDNNDFAFVYGTGNTEDGSSSTTGIQNTSPPTIGTEFVPCNTGGQGFGTAIQSICVISPSVEIVPTMGEWAIIVLMMLMLIVSVVVYKQEKTKTVIA